MKTVMFPLLAVLVLALTLTACTGQRGKEESAYPQTADTAVVFLPPESNGKELL